MERVSRVDYSLPTHVSRDAKDLIDRLLQKDPKNRLQLSQVLSHPFFDARYPVAPLSKLDTIFNNNENKRPPLDISIDSRRSRQPPLQQLRQQPRPEPSRAPQKEFLELFSIPGFTTVRLKALVQNTKHGKIEILESGSILMDFNGDPLLLLINGDGSVVELFKRVNGLRKLPDYSFPIASVPKGLHKKIKYAARFVDLVRSKTPKIIFYSPQAKCCLMENIPDAGFAVNFYDGIKAIKSDRTIIITVPKGMEANFRSSRLIESKDGFTYIFGLNDQPDQSFIALVKHFRDCMQQCLSIAAKGDGKYPLILKSNQSPLAPTRPSSPPTSVHPSQTSFYTAPLTEADRYSKTSANRQHIRSRLEMTSRQDCASVCSISPNQTHFLPQIGWCVQGIDRRFSMLFQDGAQLIVNPKNKNLDFVPRDGTLSRYNNANVVIL